MPGKFITSQQVEVFMKARKSGYTQSVSCAKAGISERSGRAIEKGKRFKKKDNHSTWRTRKDPLSAVWEVELVPLLTKSPHLQPITLLEYLQEKHKDQEGNSLYGDDLLRTLQRRVKHWKSTEGSGREVMFRQQHEPGRLGLSDFTEFKGVIITINGEIFEHRFYHFRLAYSHWSFLKVIQGGESYTALAEGLQEALWLLGGAPTEHRTDSLSAAFKNIEKDAVVDITSRYEAFCHYYRMKPTRNNPGESHENGSIESPHGHLKHRIKQALLLRGHNDFESVLVYEEFIREVTQQHNRRNAKTISIEQTALQKLPIYKTQDYTEITARVSSASTIDVRRTTYTVPSQLIGSSLRIRLYDNRLGCYLGNTLVITLKREYSSDKEKRGRKIDYRHVIHSLIKKPQAFRYSSMREDLLPNEDYRQIWRYVNETLDAKSACKFIVGALYLAETENCEVQLSTEILRDIGNKKLLAFSQYQMKFKTHNPTLPHIHVSQHNLQSYDLIASRQEVNHV
jgi:hypothetical protein